MLCPPSEASMNNTRRELLWRAKAYSNHSQLRQLQEQDNRSVALDANYHSSRKAMEKVIHDFYLDLFDHHTFLAHAAYRGASCHLPYIPRSDIILCRVVRPPIPRGSDFMNFHLVLITSITHHITLGWHFCRSARFQLSGSFYDRPQ